jgi:PHD/YefM family antitoxin component YafN of YafNO toxin-antitoxin module
MILFTLVMATIPMNTARMGLAKVIELVATETVALEEHGDAVAVIISPEQYELLVSAHEELQDWAAFDDSMAEQGPNIPWAKVQHELE